MPVPYPSDVRSNGWRFELDLDKIEQSDTWALAGTRPELRPWLLMLWAKAWKQHPCGTLPDNDQIIAAHIGMPIESFIQDREVLMRGWYRCTDGRLYHPVIINRVIEMMGKRAVDRDRQRRKREIERKTAESGENQNDSGVTHALSRVTRRTPKATKAPVSDRSRSQVFKNGGQAHDSGLNNVSDERQQSEYQGDKKRDSVTRDTGVTPTESLGVTLQELNKHLEETHTLETTPSKTNQVAVDLQEDLSRVTQRDAKPTPAGQVCMAMRKAGLADVNPGHPELGVLLAAGIPLETFVGAARDAIGRGKGFPYALAIVKRQAADSAKLAETPLAPPSPPTAKVSRNASRIAQLAPGLSDPDGARAAPAHDARVAASVPVLKNLENGKSTVIDLEPQHVRHVPSSN